MREDPLIFSVYTVQKPKAHPDGTTLFPSTTKNNPDTMKQKGDLLIRELWNNGTDSVHGIRIVNTDAKSYLVKTPEKCLHDAARAKKNRYLEACL